MGFLAINQHILLYYNLYGGDGDGDGADGGGGGDGIGGDCNDGDGGGGDDGDGCQYSVCLGLTGCLQGCDVFVPSDILHVQPPVLDLLSHCCQHAGPQSLLAPLASQTL